MYSTEKWIKLSIIRWNKSHPSGADTEKETRQGGRSFDIRVKRCGSESCGEVIGGKSFSRDDHSRHVVNIRIRLHSRYGGIRLGEGMYMNGR